MYKILIMSSIFFSLNIVAQESPPIPSLIEDTASKNIDQTPQNILPSLETNKSQTQVIIEQSVPIISNADIEQAKVIVYRGTTHSFASSRPAKIYLNDKKIGNIYKNEYIEFCLPAGKNTITSHLESSLIYSSKNKKTLLSNFEGGSTYFLRVNDDLNSTGEIYQEVDKKLDTELKNKHMKSIQTNSYIQKCDEKNVSINTIKETNITVANANGDILQ